MSRMRGVQERPAGLVVHQDVLSVGEEARLVGRFASLDLQPVVMRGVASRRRACHFGAGYDFDARTATAAMPIPTYLLNLRTRCADLAGEHPESFVEGLVTEYRAGSGIGWHKDALVFGHVVLGVSLGSDAVMRFQRRAVGGERRVHEEPLPQRSAYVLTGAARWVWQHSIPPVTELRYSVTFRQLQSGRELGGRSPG
ncbi:MULTISPECIES: alpha-ketoglutarate-dependent dioxygenase AlkB [Nocardioides]|uniref:Alpha-ketoglutarate-dependent dioxygenase AlkB n=1 Tax=Nocardioides vastitatis TaxID=2568655 RepID=A0ABW0ZEZ5_9ACTN|nr:alpha-ketoglutarate-dependent dioxygenase AlkB [Nocardioides sp.]THI96543.1 alpha-ketoglutarate-dependent dioxygenase AlkB [Nocardioides sp.]